MPRSTQQTGVRFGPYELDFSPPALREDGRPVEIGATALRLLVALAQARGEYVTKEALIAKVWDGTAVSDASVYSALRQARRVVGDDGRRQQVVATRKGRGYRFVAPVETPATPRLSADEVSERLTVNGRPPPRALVRRFLDRTGGDAALVDALAERLEAEGLRGLAAVLPAESIPLPAPVIETRMESLPPLPEALQPTLQAVAVLGREFPTDPSPLLGLDAEACRRDLVQATESEWIESVPDGSGRLRFRISAAREHLLRRAPDEHIAKWHHAAARGLAGPEAAGELEASRRIAHHLRLAGAAADRGDAIAWYRHAADAALAARDPEEAIVHGEAALAMANHLPAAERFEILVSLGDARFVHSDHAGGRDAFLRAAALARAQRDVPRLARAALGHAGAIANTETAAFSVERLRLLEEALSHAEALDPVTVARLEARLAFELRWTERSAEVPERARNARDWIRGAAEASADDRVSVLHDVYWALWSPENLDTRLALAAEMADASRHSRDPVQPLIASALHGASLLESGDRAGAEIAYARGEEWAPADSHAGLALWAPTLRASFALLDGRFAEAESRMSEARRTGRKLGARNADLIFAAQLAWLRFDQGRLGELGAAVPVPLHTGIPLTRAGVALILAHAGRTTEARAELDGLVTGLAAVPRDPFWLATMATLVEIAVATGAPEPARRLRDELAPYPDRCVVLGVRTACRGSVALYLGLAERVQQRTDAAIGYLEQAVDANARLRAGPILARTQLELAHALALRDAPGDRSSAEALLQEATRIRAVLGVAEDRAARDARARVDAGRDDST